MAIPCRFYVRINRRRPEFKYSCNSRGAQISKDGDLHSVGGFFSPVPSGPPRSPLLCRVYGTQAETGAYPAGEGPHNKPILSSRQTEPRNEFASRFYDKGRRTMEPSKILKSQILASSILFWIGLIWFFGTFRNPTNGTVIAVLMLVGGLCWFIATKIVIWWKRK
jgi:hypothetical protein